MGGVETGRVLRRNGEEKRWKRKRGDEIKRVIKRKQILKKKKEKKYEHDEKNGKRCE